MTLAESIVEHAALTWFGDLGSFCDVLLVVRLRETVLWLNPTIPKGARVRIADVVTVRTEQRQNP
jgi:hypothetical protein